mgnify:CR=1 FL=1
MKNALIYNHKAGRGLAPGKIIEKLSAFLGGEELLAADPGLCVPGLPLRLVERPVEELAYYPRLRACVEALVQAGAERFICVGGDGTAAYVRTAMYELGVSLPILGVAAGTANVGPIVSVSLEQLESRRIGETREVCCDGLSVFSEGKFLALAFNDVVVGDTFLATVEGRIRNVSVRALLEQGELTVQKPSRDIVSEDFQVLLNGSALRPNLRSIQQIVLSSAARENHYGRAIYGVIGRCDWSEKKGVIALCDHIVVSFEESGAGVNRCSSMEYLIFGPEDQVILQGFAPDACLICDGNPYLLPSPNVQVRYEPALVRTTIL